MCSKYKRKKKTANLSEPRVSVIQRGQVNDRTEK